MKLNVIWQNVDICEHGVSLAPKHDSQVTHTPISANGNLSQHTVPSPSDLHSDLNHFYFQNFVMPPGNVMHFNWTKY